jgi:peptidyl-prolyl cis-trans isomerase A (cyclophilin A)
MANRGKNTNGAQFFITDAPAPHLDGGFTIFGQCSPVELVHQIAGMPTVAGNRPSSRIGIDRVTITVR